MVFVETTLFTKLLGDYLGDEEYRALQGHLIVHPDAGAINLRRIIGLLAELTRD